MRRGHSDRPGLARPDRDAGQVASIAMIPVVVGLVAVTLLLIVGVGDGTSSHSETGTAADAAALAAAAAWRDAVQDTYDGGPAAAATLIGRNALGVGGSAAATRATTFAGRNGADLVTLVPINRGDAVEFQVTVRASQPAEQTDFRPVATAMARVELTGGLCLDGGRFGLRGPGGCETDTTTPTPSATPTGGATATPTPSPSPPWQVFADRIRLVA